VTEPRTPYLTGLRYWLTNVTGAAEDPLSVSDRLFRRLLAAGVPLLRANIAMTTLHPEIIGFSYRWTRESDETVQLVGNRDAIEGGRMYDRSPYKLIFEQGYIGIRRRIERPDEQRDLSLIDDLEAAGATDYVVMAASSGYTGGVIASWATDRPGGFTTAELVTVERELQTATDVLENRSLRDIAVYLLDTYVGHRAGTRILTGEISRGSSETLEAVIWLVDMRGFTPLSDSLPGDQLIALLNDYYDRAITPVQAHGGEVIKFIGDGVLAIFPTDREGGAPAACRAALAATDDVLAAMTDWNGTRAAQGEDTIGYGIVMHLGEVSFGNVGTANRLDFTVIGPAVNLASRLERLCSERGETVLLSRAVADHIGTRAELIGVEQLRGLSQPQAVYRLTGS
jgi:adenylate cyclase